MLCRDICLSPVSLSFLLSFFHPSPPTKLHLSVTKFISTLLQCEFLQRLYPVFPSFRDAAVDRGYARGTHRSAQCPNNTLCDRRISAVPNRVGILTKKTKTKKRKDKKKASLLACLNIYAHVFNRSDDYCFWGCFFWLGFYI